MNKVNSDKSHPLMSGNMNATANIDNNIIESGDVHRLLQITIDSKLMFENRITSSSKKASLKLKDLAIISNYMAFDESKIIMKRSITSQFSYCPFGWMLHSKRLSKKINILTERALGITYRD